MKTIIEGKTLITGLVLGVVFAWAVYDTWLAPKQTCLIGWGDVCAIGWWSK